MIPFRLIQELCYRVIGPHRQHRLSAEGPTVSRSGLVGGPPVLQELSSCIVSSPQPGRCVKERVWLRPVSLSWGPWSLDVRPFPPLACGPCASSPLCGGGRALQIGEVTVLVISVLKNVALRQVAVCLLVAFEPSVHSFIHSANGNGLQAKGRGAGPGGRERAALGAPPRPGLGG